MLVLATPQIAKTRPIKVIYSPKLVPPTQAKKPLVRNPLIRTQMGPLVRGIQGKNPTIPQRKGKNAN